MVVTLRIWSIFLNVAWENREREESLHEKTFQLNFSTQLLEHGTDADGYANELQHKTVPIRKEYSAEKSVVLKQQHKELRDKCNEASDWNPE